MDERQPGESTATPAKYVDCHCCAYRLYVGEPQYKAADSEGVERTYCSPYCAAGKHSVKEAVQDE